MSSFVYIVTEGVHDVAFLGRLLVIAHQAKRVKKLEDLDDAMRAWLGRFKWPVAQGSHHDISRLGVPAPVFYRLASKTVAFRNAQGITEIEKTLTVDLEAFSRGTNPEAVGVVLDSDDKSSAERFDEVKRTLEDVGLASPPSLGAVTQGTPKVGAFSFPEPGQVGTLEDLLLKLGDAAYPELAASGRAHASHWRAHAEREPNNRDWRELRKPAGTKKATIAAMTAVLKPGKAMAVSLEDNLWVTPDALELPALDPCLTFLNELLR